jgi:hypothetical protein
LDGSLGETSANDTTGSTFLEQLSLVDGIQGVYRSLYGTGAEAADKGIDDFFGSLRGTLASAVDAVGQAAKIIASASLAEQTAYETALQNFNTHLDTLDDSSFFDESTFNALLSTIETTAANFDTVLSTDTFLNQKNSQPSVTPRLHTRQHMLGSCASINSRRKHVRKANPKHNDVSQPAACFARALKVSDSK